MPLRSLDHMESRGKGLVTYAGSFAPNGASAIAASSREGQGFTVARTGVGEYTVTLLDRPRAIVAVDASIQLTTAANLSAQIGPVTLTSTGATIVIRALAAAVPTEIAAAAGNRVNFRVIARMTSAPPSRGG